MNNSPNIPVEFRQYVLRHKYRCNTDTYEYYTGNKPTRRMHEAKLFSLKYAKATKQFAHTGLRYEIKRVTEKMLFKAALDGK